MRLLTLKEVEHLLQPIELTLGYFEQTLIESLRFVDFEFDGPPTWTDCPSTLNTADEVFEVDGRRVSLNDLADLAMKEEDLFILAAKKTFIFRTLEPCIYVGPRERVPIQIRAEVELRTTQQRLPVTLESYEQVDHAGAVAWLQTAHTDIGGRQVALKVIFVEGNDGRLVPAAIGALGGLARDAVAVRFGVGPTISVGRPVHDDGQPLPPSRRRFAVER